MFERVVRPPQPFDLGSTLSLLARARSDPTARWLSPRELARATRTADGPAAMTIRAEGPEVVARAWGPGAGRALEALPAVLGCDDDPSGFTPVHPVIRDLHRRMRGLRLGRTGAVMEALVPAIIEQKVTGKEAFGSWRRLVRRYGEPAPGPLDLMLLPDPAVLASLPYWRLHPLGLERRRAETVLRACASARRLEEAATMTPVDAARRLRAIRGIGAWTAAEVTRTALGDPDAVSVGDFHLKNHVAWVLAGEARATDERMLELLEPYAGHRARVIRLIELGAPTPPRFGPRVRLRAIERI